MPRAAVDDNKRMNLWLRPEQKATLIRAASLRHTDLTDFVLKSALRKAKAVIAESARIILSERDSLLVLNLLENPPAPKCQAASSHRLNARTDAEAGMSLPVWHEEPILKRRDRKSLDCGDPSMNDFLQRYARRSHESGAAKTFLQLTTRTTRPSSGSTAR